MVQAVVIILVLVVSTTLLSWAYFRRYAITRPVMGVFDLGDILVMITAVILVPFMYLLLPIGVVAFMLTLGSLSFLYITLEPVLKSAWAIWLVAVGMVLIDLVTALIPGIRPVWFIVSNNMVMVFSIVGVSNLWAQSGMKARDAAILGIALAVYDWIATSFLPLMTNLFRRLDDLPFAPMLVWQIGPENLYLSIGIGDLLLASVFPLVARKAFGWPAGILALILANTAIGLLTLGLMYGILAGPVPVMVILGPLMIVQYIYWKRRLGGERTTWQYWQAELPGKVR